MPNEWYLWLICHEHPWILGAGNPMNPAFICFISNVAFPNKASYFWKNIKSSYGFGMVSFVECEPVGRIKNGTPNCSLSKEPLKLTQPMANRFRIFGDCCT